MLTNIILKGCVRKNLIQNRHQKKAFTTVQEPVLEAKLEEFTWGELNAVKHALFSVGLSPASNALFLFIPVAVVGCFMDKERLIHEIEKRSYLYDTFSFKQA